MIFTNLHAATNTWNTVGKAKEKGQKLFDCNKQYANTINNLDQNTIDLLLSTTDDKTMEFYDNHNHIRTISLLS